MLLQKLLAASLESEVVPAQATSAKEQEITIYAKIGNPDGLKQASSSEEQTQAEVKIDKNRRLRVRKTVQPSGDTTYVLTTKLALDSEDGVRSFTENNANIDAATFELFVAIVPSYQRKTRYIFNIEKITVENEDGSASLDIDGFKYEVDVFLNAEGKPSEWCKIDLEIQDLQQKFEDAGVSVDKFNINVAAGKLPFDPSEFIIMDEDTSKEDRDHVSKIYDEQFLTFQPGETPKEKQEEVVDNVESATQTTVETPEEAKPAEQTTESSDQTA